jgi:hypothetical protein
VDTIPLRGEAPTTSWVSGEVIADEYDIVVQPSAPPSTYAIEIGMYALHTGERLSVYDARNSLVGDRILLPEIAVGPGS